MQTQCSGKKGFQCGINVIKFYTIQNGMMEITKEEGMKEFRPTSSFLESDGLKVVIDATHPKEDKKQYYHAMMKLGFSPDEVDAVIFTHLHPDHFGHKDLFTNAVFVFHEAEKFGPVWFKDDKKTVLNGHALLNLTPEGIESPEYTDHVPDFRTLENRLYIRHIPGHSPGSLAIFANIDHAVHSWVGDTFSNREAFYKNELPHCSWDRDQIPGHVEFIKTHADVIVPGHGPAFRLTFGTIPC